MSEQKIKELKTIYETLNSLDRRIMHLETTFKKIDVEISSSDHKLDLLERKAKRALEILHKRTHTLKVDSENLNKKIIKCISMIRHLAHQTDINNLKEKLRQMKIDEMVSENDIKKMVEIKLLQERESLN